MQRICSRKERSKTEQYESMDFLQFHIKTGGGQTGSIKKRTAHHLPEILASYEHVQCRIKPWVRDNAAASMSASGNVFLQR